MAINTREEFEAYVLRKLGDGVITINVSPGQVSDRVDEAIEYWRENHYNGYQKRYLKYQLTQQDIDNGYLSPPTDIRSVVRMLPLSNNISGSSFDLQYQLMSDLTLSSAFLGDLTSYYISMQYMGLIQETFASSPPFFFNKYDNKIYLEALLSDYGVGTWFVFEIYANMNNQEMWNDRFLQNYAAALVKVQWGSNLMKFSGTQLVGGQQFNGETIYQEGETWRKELEDEAYSKYITTADFMA